MSLQVIADTLRQAGVNQQTARATARYLIAALVQDLKRTGTFALPGFGRLTVRRTKARMALNPRTGERIKVKAGKTIRFKPSPTLRRSV